MPQTLAKIFGNSATYNDTNKTITINLNNLKNLADGGLIKNNLGINDLTTITAANIDSKAAKIFYGLLVLISQTQSATVNDDSTENIYLTEGGIRIATGTRAGQLQRVINVNVFDTSGVIANLVDIDNV
jgi:hypothetical protein